MNFEGSISYFPSYIKHFIAVFVLVLSIGYFTGLMFVGQTNSHHPDGVEENYLGNEEDINAETMKFKKGEREMLTILHTHILSISFIFFIMGGLIACTSLSKKIKAFLMIEPFVSIILTFGGVFLLWKGLLWMKWVVIASGTLMTVVYVISAGTVLFQLYNKR
jgi:hypothetical protein